MNSNHRNDQQANKILSTIDLKKIVLSGLDAEPIEIHIGLNWEGRLIKSPMKSKPPK